MFDYARMTAPFDGVVTQIYAYTGALLPGRDFTNEKAIRLFAGWRRTIFCAW